MNKAGKNEGMKFLVGFAVIAVLGLLVYMAFGMQQAVVPGAPSSGGITAPGICSTPCPDDLTWNGTINVQNALNNTGVETYDTTTYFYTYSDGAIENLKSKITDTISGSVSLTCGQEYLVEVISTDGAAGDSSEILSAPSNAELTADGSAIFTACGDGSTMTFKMNQRGVPEVRAKDVINDGFMYTSTGSPNTDYHTTDGVAFNATANGTAQSVGSGGELHVIQYVRANLDDNDFNDQGVIVLIDAAPSVWDEPTIKIDGVVKSDSMASLNADERIAYSDYEYAYLIPKDRAITKNGEVSVDINIFALSGVDPTVANAISVDYAVRGKYESTTESDTVKLGAVKDDSSKTQVYTLHDTVLNMV